MYLLYSQYSLLNLTHAPNRIAIYKRGKFDLFYKNGLYTMFNVTFKNTVFVFEFRVCQI